MTYEQFVKDEELKQALDRISEMMGNKMLNDFKIESPSISEEIIVEMKVRPLRSIEYIDLNFTILPTGTISDGFGE